MARNPAEGSHTKAHTERSGSDDEYFKQNPNAARLREHAQRLLTEPGATKESVLETLKNDFGADDETLAHIFRHKPQSELQQQAQAEGGDALGADIERKKQDALSSLIEARQKGNKGTKILNELKKLGVPAEEIDEIDRSAGEPAKRSRRTGQSAEPAPTFQDTQPESDNEVLRRNAEYILQERAAGKSDETIAAEIREGGWGEQEMAEMFEAANAAARPQVASESSPAEADRPAREERQRVPKDDREQIRRDAVQVLKDRESGKTDQEITKLMEASGLSADAIARRFKIAESITKSKEVKILQQNVDAVIQGRQAGIPEEEIVERLKKVGWTDRSIREILFQADRRPLPEHFERPEFEMAKRYFDPLRQYLGKLVDDRKNNLRFRDILPHYGIGLAPEEEKEGAKVTWASVTNFHDFLRRLWDMPESQRQRLRTRLFTEKQFQDRLSDPNDPLHAYREEWEKLVNRAVRPRTDKERLPDEYARRAWRGDVYLEVPEEAWDELSQNTDVLEGLVPSEPSQESLAVGGVPGSDVYESVLLNEPAFESDLDDVVPDVTAEGDVGSDVHVGTGDRYDTSPFDDESRPFVVTDADRRAWEAASRPKGSIHGEAAASDSPTIPVEQFDDAFNRLYPPVPGSLTTSAPDDVFDRFYDLRERYQGSLGDEKAAIASELISLLSEPAPMSGPASEAESSVPERYHIYSDDELRMMDEDTPLGWRNRLKNLIKGRLGNTKEKVDWWKSAEEGLARRSAELDAEAGKLGGGLEEKFRSWGEKYNKLSFLKKVGIGVTLGAGAVAFTTVSMPAAFACLSGIAVQRVYGLSSTFLKVEKYLQENRSRNLGLGPLRIREDKISEASLALATVYSVFMGAIISEAVHVVNQTEIGHAVQSKVGEIAHATQEKVSAWLGGILHQEYDAGGNPILDSNDSASATGTPSSPGSGAPAAHPTPQPGAPGVRVDAVPSPKPMEAAPAVDHKAPLPPVTEQPAPQANEAASVVPPEAMDIDVAASKGHGAEYMMKQLWEQMQEKDIKKLPENADHNSDLWKLAHADKNTIDSVVHKIAMEPRNTFFHADGTNVLINSDSHMTIDARGNISLSHIDMDKVTPAYRPEVAAHAAVPEGIVEKEIAVPEPIGGPFDHPIAPIDSESVSASADTHAAASDALPPVENHDFVINAHEVTVPLAEAHIYSDGKNLMVYGGLAKDQAPAILKYLSGHPEATVFSGDDDGKYRVPWKLAQGKLVLGQPVKTNGLLGIFQRFVPPPGPEEFTKVVQ